MTRLKTAAIAAIAISLVAGPALASEVRVKITGKTVQQLHEDIVRAASKVCWDDTRGDPLATYIYADCVRRTVSVTLDKIGDANLVAYSQANPFRVRLAAR